ncbi:hypothetical protein [Thalassomonas haliotis]|uniref:Uncharacterized protein n=1 Tax=Thalassomonas haliotis TaxID=485448 RepID=A0ABY7VBY8_9GAMM|nr:hypothetical protein [Thalassomonas haliotis]WDE10860.1 hypothetical protein H3N35_21830 [Thalassomonas haliotis]
MSSVPEKDWKLFRKLQADLTVRVCDSVFVKVEELAKSRKNKEHQSYLDLYELIQEQDQLIGEYFNNPTRNNALLKIVALQSNNILTKEEFSLFSEETQIRVNEIIELRR